MNAIQHTRSSTRAFGLGPLPGTDIVEAASMVQGETGACPHLPDLPRRSLHDAPEARTLAMTGYVGALRGPRGWVLSGAPNPTHVEALHRDLDVVEAVWGGVGAFKLQVLGPLSLASRLELSDGYPALRDSAALADLVAAMAEGIRACAQQLAARLGPTPGSPARVLVQIDEPDLPTILAGKVRGPSIFDPVRPVHERDAADLLGELVRAFEGMEVLLNQSGYAPVWSVSPCPLLVDVESIRTSEAKDGFGAALDQRSVALGVSGADVAREPRAVATRLARFAEELGVDPARLSTVDVVPLGVLTSPRDAYAGASQLADILTRDAGDL